MIQAECRSYYDFGLFLRGLLVGFFDLGPSFFVISVVFFFFFCPAPLAIFGIFLLFKR